MIYEFVRPGPNGEQIGDRVERLDIKMNGIVTTKGMFIPWSYLRPTKGGLK